MSSGAKGLRLALWYEILALRAMQRYSGWIGHKLGRLHPHNQIHFMP